MRKGFRQTEFNSLSSSKGFTLIELIVVIVILGLLAATALPRFLDVTDEAEAAAVEGVGGGFASGIALAHARWLADGFRPGQADQVVTLEGSQLNMNENGWPANTENGIGAGLNDQTEVECRQVWDTIMHSPPSLTTSPGDRGKGRYHVTVLDANPDVCRYELASVPLATPPTHRIDYNVATGQVNIVVPSLN